MTDPEQVSVNVADLRTVVDAWRAHDEPWWPQGAMQRIADIAFPEPEWEPTDDITARVARAYEETLMDQEAPTANRRRHSGEGVAPGGADPVTTVECDDCFLLTAREAEKRHLIVTGMPLIQCLKHSASEWEPTDDMRQKIRRTYGDVHGFVPDDTSPAYFDDWLRVLHREGLIP